ncbi:sensor histidine kinase [Paenibacillus sp. OAS669]|uniref:sensor histidine kinase n=1 Tax=Paenibacillus sp. OAS669 TaxID=2663821 RepID=UPI00178A0F95|nr:sensor histidine kinase [Paenibacillus sp. OAS669]MBE1442911.1 signal transduction histidine kinase [Paenibacillus sp. OAS669]
MKYYLYGKPVTDSALLFFLMQFNHFFQGPPLKIVLNGVLWVTYTFMLFLPKKLWTRTRLMLAACLLLLEAAVGVFGFQEINLIYIIAIILFVGAIRLSFIRLQTPAILAICITAAFYVKFGSGDIFNIISFLFFATALYFSIRSRRQRNEMYELNKKHLEELQSAYDQLHQASATAMQYAVLEERTRIARDIHDAVGHSLTSLIVQIQALRYMVKADPERAAHSLDGMLAVARQGLQDIRTSVHALADNRSIPGVTGLKSLLARMEATASIAYTFHTDLQDREVEAEAYETCFRVLQEAITNIIRHSQATQVEVGLFRRSDKLVMSIRDNGVVKAINDIKEGYGIKVMKTRLEELGGSLLLTSLAPSGLELTAAIPYRDRSSGEWNEED